MTDVEKKQAQQALDAACEDVGEKTAVCAGHTLEEVEAATDEVHRELTMRERCFPGWIASGRLSKTDAKDRLDRLSVARKILLEVLDKLRSGAVPF